MQIFRIFFTFVLIFSLASVSTGRVGRPDKYCKVCLWRSAARECMKPCRGAPPPSKDCAECVKELAPECMEACGVAKKIIYEKSEEFDVQRNNRLAVLPYFGNQFKVSFQMFINSLDLSGWSSIIRLTTTDQNCCEVNDRIFALWIYKGLLVGGYHTPTYYIFESSGIPMGKRTGRWLDFEISFLSKDTDNYVFELKIDGQVLWQKEGRVSSKFQAVSLFAGDKFDDPLNGKIRSLTIVDPETNAPSTNPKTKGVTDDADGKRCRLNNLEGLPGDYARCHNNGEWKLDEPIKNITDTVVSNGGKLDELLDRPPPGPGPWCIEDNPRRVFTTYTRPAELTTVDYCIKFCYDYHKEFDPHTKDGFFYAGLEVGNQCFCGQYVPLNLLRPSDECDFVCAGAENGDERPCGGFWRLSVYPTNLPPTPTPTTPQPIPTIPTEY